MSRSVEIGTCSRFIEWRMSLSANRYPPSDQVRGQASPEHALLRIEPRLDPWRADIGAAEFDALVQPERPVAPELHGQRHDPVAAPIRRPRHGTDRIFRRIERDRLFEGKAIFHRAR